MSFPDEQEQDWKRPMVSPAAVQRSQDCEPQTARKAWFEALKRRFETPTKSEEESPLHGPVKRQKQPPPKVPQTACPWGIILQDPPEDPTAQPLKVTE